MQSRYLGSDALSQRQLEAQQLTAEANLLANQRLQKASGSLVDSVVEGQAAVAKLQIENETAKARAAGSGSFANFGKSLEGAVEAYGRYEQNQEKQKLREQEAAAKRAQAEAEALSQQQFNLASEELANLEQNYLRTNWNDGVRNFKADATKVLAKYNGVAADKQSTLIDRINGVATSREQQVFSDFSERVKRQMNSQRDAAANTLLIGLGAELQVMEKLPPTEQARPYLESIQGKLDNFMAENNGLDFESKLEVMAQMSGHIQKAFAGKAESYGTFLSDLKARNEWQIGWQQAYAEFQAGRISKQELNDRVLTLNIRTGKDFSKYMVQPGELERDALANAKVIQEMQSIRDAAREKVGLTFSLDPEESRTIAAGILTRPGYQQELEADPLLSKNPSVKNGIELAKAVQAARTDLAKLFVDRKRVDQQLAEYDLTNANNFANVTRSLATKTSNRQELTPQEQYFSVMLGNLAAASPEAARAIQEIQATAAGGGKLTPEQLQQIQATLTSQSAAITAAKNEANAIYNQQVQEFNVKHDAVIKLFGGIPDDKALQSVVNTSGAKLQQKLTELKQQAEQAAQQSVQSPAFGSQSNFSQPGQGVAAFGQANGRYKVAPRTANAVIQVQGKPMLSPMQVGARNPVITSGRATASRSNHAGLDFGLHQGENAMSVVGGTVAKVGWDASGYGTYVDVRGDNGYIYRYAHIRSFVRQGEQVQAGQPIGTPNLSGRNTGAHLHFEVRDAKVYDKGGQYQYGLATTIDPVPHLQALAASAGKEQTTAPGLVGQPTQGVRTQAPWAVTTVPSIFTGRGGVVSSGLFQQVGQPALSASKVFTNQRPLQATSGRLPDRQVLLERNNPNADYGYAYLRQNTSFRQKLAQAADRLGVPAVWIADIMAQESGQYRMATQVHPGATNQNYGLFGFGRDSGVANWTNLNPEQQLDAYVRYMETNGWQRHRSRKAGNVSVGELWAVTRMGTNWRRQILEGRDPRSLRLNDTGKTYADELALLGKWVGRGYDLGGSGRTLRNKGVGKRASSSVGQALAAVQTDVPYRVEEM